MSHHPQRPIRREDLDAQRRRAREQVSAPHRGTIDEVRSRLLTLGHPDVGCMSVDYLPGTVVFAGPRVEEALYDIDDSRPAGVQFVAPDELVRIVAHQAIAAYKSRPRWWQFWRWFRGSV